MSFQITSPNTEAAILARVIQVGEKELSRGAAEYLESVRFGVRDIARMNELSELGCQGKLTSQEQAELDSSLLDNQPYHLRDALYRCCHFWVHESKSACTRDDAQLALATFASLLRTLAP